MCLKIETVFPRWFDGSLRSFSKQLFPIRTRWILFFERATLLQFRHQHLDNINERIWSKPHKQD